MKLRRFGAHLCVRHAAHDLVDYRKRAVDGLEDLKRLLLHDVERAPDALVGDVVKLAIANPRGVDEQRRRQNHRGDHHKLQQASGRFPCTAHQMPHPELEFERDPDGSVNTRDKDRLNQTREQMCVSVRGFSERECSTF